MNKRILASIAAVGMTAATFGAFGSTAQAACRPGDPSPVGFKVAEAGDRTVYLSEDPAKGNTDGYVGSKSGVGFIEAGGGSSGSFYLKGRANGTPVVGTLNISADGVSACLADVDILP